MEGADLGGAHVHLDTGHQPVSAHGEAGGPLRLSAERGQGTAPRAAPAREIPHRSHRRIRLHQIAVQHHPQLRSGEDGAGQLQLSGPHPGHLQAGAHPNAHRSPPRTRARHRRELVSADLADDAVQLDAVLAGEPHGSLSHGPPALAHRQSDAQAVGALRSSVQPAQVEPGAQEESASNRRSGPLSGHAEGLAEKGAVVGIVGEAQGLVQLVEGAGHGTGGRELDDAWGRARRVGLVLGRLLRRLLRRLPGGLLRHVLGGVGSTGQHHHQQRQHGSSLHGEAIARHSPSFLLCYGVPPAAGEVMHANAELIHRFYEAFARRDAQAMAACYAPDVTFSDPAFPDLKGPEVGAMWAMLCHRGKDLVIRHSEVQADDHTGSAHWDADYTFGVTGRMVNNSIDATFTFRDGLIATHVDRFGFWKWSRMALGPTGLLLGWTPIVRNKVRSQADKGLRAWMKEHGIE